MIGFLKKLGKGAAWPFERISEEVGKELAEKVSLSVRAGLAEAPILDAILDGKEVELAMRFQLRVKE